MKFAIQINEGPYTHQATDSAYHFVKAAIDNGHEVMRVFFYHDGVNNGTRLTTPPQDDRHIVNRWAELAKQHDLDLVLCVAAAQRRGIADEGEAQRNGKDANNIQEGFRISGLGQLIEAGIQADRLLVFGD
ncbi:sulfurtransferase complex subunit TusD [Sulfuriflexus mobilis]|uniref:sulfurtransferase complex subunit TusD n=1 Tax=Sulfuriflexus mobilis TaxID=1811807 RepID=UPI000F838703|nr:sulfurtransferase complex subunit TusD [Sulfuriflexus mobilis]